MIYNLLRPGNFPDNESTEVKKMEYYDRLLFGKEQRLILGLGDCPACETKRGSLHEYGCVAEECPKCHRPIVACHCQCLEPEEGKHIVAGIILSMTEADVIRLGEGIKDMKTLSYTNEAVIKSTMEGLLGLTPCGIGDDGFPTYDLHAVALQLGMTDTEKAHMMAACGMG